MGACTFTTKRFAGSGVTPAAPLISLLMLRMGALRAALLEALKGMWDMNGASGPTSVRSMMTEVLLAAAAAWTSLQAFL
jgi:hypothetical protein